MDSNNFEKSMDKAKPAESQVGKMDPAMETKAKELATTAGHNFDEGDFRKKVEKMTDEEKLAQKQVVEGAIAIIAQQKAELNNNAKDNYKQANLPGEVPEYDMKA